LIKKISYIVTFFGIITIILSFYFLSPKAPNSIIVQFVARNGYGNNLYLDNISFGKRHDIDVAVTSINNIPKDTTYLNDVFSFKIAPQINITNLGYSTVLNDSIFFVVNSIPHLVFDTVSLSPGQTKVITFDSIEFFVNTTYDIRAFVYKIEGDTIQNNDTLKQTTVFLPGAARNILLEEFTSSTSPSCASNNPALDMYIDTNIQHICAVKYHLGFPIPGIDSMYIADSIQQNQRANYYFVYSVPSTFLDGKIRLPLPYILDTNMPIPFNSRFLVGSPLSVNVTDARLPGDTIQATIDINLLHTLASNNLRLRVYAIERRKLYSSPPGSNGETNFYDIFRQAYPDSAGIIISNVLGTYQYIYKYHRDSTWTDSLVYTLAFVQDDNTKEVLNCGKGRQIRNFFKSYSNIKPVSIIRKADLKNKIPLSYHRNIIKDKDSLTPGDFSIEGFEGPFPPLGWTVLNPDVGFTFEKLNGYNGPSFGGVNCVKVPFYDYPNIGEKDTLISIAYTGVTALDTFRFDLSYAQYLSGYNDSLIVNMSIDGGLSYTTIFAEGGPYMSTSSATTLSYAPTSSTQWTTYIYPMSAILPLRPSVPVPEVYKLYQNYPNPFNPTTNIKFDLPRNVFVTLKIYDILGREIITLVNQKMEAGPKIVPFTPTNLASGIYFYRITAGDFTDVKKLVFIK
jgi:hypothetical protein